MIGSVATSWRATAFALALAEHALAEATAADRTAGGGGADLVPPASVRPPADSERGVADDGREGLSDGGRDAEPAEQALLLGLADRLQGLPRPALAPDVKAVQRAQLIAAMEAELASPEARAGRLPEQRDRRSRKGTHRAPALTPLTRLRPRSRLSKGLAAGGLGVGVAASALGGVASASSDALPGDSLYGVKRGMEDLRLNLAGDEADRGQVHLDHASTRMKEARRLMERARGGAELDHESLTEIRKALSGMRSDATEGHRLLSSAYEKEGSIAPMRTLSSFSTDHRRNWDRLRDRLPAQLSDVRDEVSSVFDAMDSDVAPLAGLISGSRKETSGDGGRDGAGDARDGRRSPGPSASPDAHKSGPGGGDKSGTPSPSGSGRPGGELVDGGLLDPPRGQHGDSSGHDSGRESRPRSEVTLPPIVPDVLPGLGGLSEDD